MNTSTSTDIVDLMNSTQEDDALLAAWLGELDTLCAFWPTSDRDAFKAALRQWIPREFAVGDRDDDGHQETIEEMVERVMMFDITITLPDVSDGMIEDLRAKAVQAGDLDMVDDCDLALDDDDDEARGRCRDAILAARAMA